MGVSRRAMLVTGGAVAVLIGTKAWDLSRVAQKAREPWRQAGESFGDPRLDILSYAVLAPSPHNMQPWQIRLEGDDEMAIYCDLSRLLPETDPPHRQITIGFGCFLEVLRQAAAEKGYRTLVTPFPMGEPEPHLDHRPIAYVRLEEAPDVKKDPLFGGLLTRRTNRAPFDTSRPVPQEMLDKLTAEVSSAGKLFANAEPALRDDVRALTVAAWEAEWANPATRRESLDLMRIGRKEVNENPDGISVEGFFPQAVKDLGLLSAEQMDDPNSSAYKQSLDMYNEACDTAMGHLWFISRAAGRSYELEAGRVWVRAQLEANAMGLSFHPLSQALQEFPAMAEHYTRAHELLGAKDGEVVQMLIRLGYGPKIARPAPRWPLESRLIAQG